MRLLTLALALTLGACAAEAPAPEAAEASPEASADATSFGTTVPDGDALSPAELIAQADDLTGKTVLVEGEVREACQMAGCWLTLTDDQGRTVRVEVPRDESESYVYTFPKDISGATVRLTGLLDVETESVADLRHYAEDGGASPAEVAAITEPRQTLVLTAAGAELTDRPAGPPVTADA